MSSDDDDRTIPRTQWTDALLGDLFAALKKQRDDETVRAFARELMDEKDLPIAYLVRKVAQKVDTQAAERLDVLIRSRWVVERSKTEHQRSGNGVRSLLRTLSRLIPADAVRRPPG